MRVDQLDPSLLGILVCVIIRAKNLPDKSVIGKQSPYATISFGLNKKRTKTIARGGQQPNWDEEFRFEIPKDINAAGSPSLAAVNKHGGVSSSSAAGTAKAKVDPAPVVLPNQHGKRILRLAVYADDAKDPSLIGEALVELEDTIKKGNFDEWVQLEHKNRYAGEIYLELTWYHNGPRPQPKKQKPTMTASASSYGGAGLRVTEDESEVSKVDEYDQSANRPGSSLGYPQRPPSQNQNARRQSYGGAPLELAADYPDPDVGPLSNSMSTMALGGRPALPQPPTHQQHPSHSSSYYDTPPQSATSSYSRPLPDPRHASGGYNQNGAYDQQPQRQWRHSSAGPYGSQNPQHNPYAGGPPAHQVGEFGAPSAGYVGYPPNGAEPPQQHYQQHHQSYSDVGHSSDYGPPPQPLGEFEQLAQQHHHAYSNQPPQAAPYSSTPVPPAQPYYGGPPAGPPQPPQPPMPPASPAHWPQPNPHPGLPLPPQPPAHLLGRSQSVVSLATNYSAYGPPPAAGGYGAPLPPQPPVHPGHFYSPAPPPQPYHGGGGPPLPPQPPAPPAPYGGAYAQNDYGPPPGAYREPSPAQPQQGNYLRQQYAMNVAQQQGNGLPLPPQPPVRPGSGQGAYNPYAWQGQ